jgi:hypothetical protein
MSVTNITFVILNLFIFLNLTDTQLRSLSVLQQKFLINM